MRITPTIVTTRQGQGHPSEHTPGSVANSIVQRVTETDAGLLLALAAAAGVRLMGIFARPIWYDEAFAILFSQQGPARMVVGTLTPTGAGSADIHPLGYYSILWLWMRIFGESLLSARGLSILAGLAMVFVGYLLVRNLVDRRTAFVAALMLGISPFLVHYSQEIRMYAFLGLWLTMATFCFRKAVNEAGWTWWVGFAVSAALAQYTHNLAAAYLLALALWPVVQGDWKTALRLALAALVAVLLYMPWLVNIPAQFAKVSQAYWIEQPSLYRLLALPLAFITNLPVPPPLLGAAMFAALGIMVVGLLATIRGARLRRGRDHASQWMLYMSFAPSLLLFVFSQWKPVFLERALIGSGVAFCIWLACQLTDDNVRPAARWMLATLTALGFGIGLWLHLTYTGFPYAPYDSIAADLRTRLQPGDAIIHSSKLSYLPSFYFDRGLPETFIADPPGSSSDTLAPSTQMVLGVQASPSLEEAAGTAKRVWFAIFDQSNEEYVQAGYSEHPHLTWLLHNYKLSETREWDDLNVYLFTSDRPQ